MMKTQGSCFFSFYSKYNVIELVFYGHNCPKNPKGDTVCLSTCSTSQAASKKGVPQEQN